MHSYKIRSSVKPHTDSPAPRTGARLLFDSGQQRRRGAFASGVLPYVPHYGSRPYTVADEAWWAEESNQPERLQHSAIMQEMADFERWANEISEEREWELAYEAGMPSF